jgi:hypothetical protein
VASSVLRCPETVRALGLCRGGARPGP